MRLAEDLEAVADAQHRPALLGEADDLGHDGAEAGDGPGPDVVAVGEASRQHDRVEAGDVGVAVPDVLGLVAEVLRGADDVLLAVGAGEDDDAEAHGYSSTVSMR